MERSDIFNATHQALHDWWNERGGYYSGPGTPVYLAVKAILADAELTRITRGVIQAEHKRAVEG